MFRRIREIRNEFRPLTDRPERATDPTVSPESELLSPELYASWGMDSHRLAVEFAAVCHRMRAMLRTS